MPRRMTSGPAFVYRFRVVWTDPVTFRRRSKAFVWRGPAERERDYRHQLSDAILVELDSSGNPV